MADERDRQEGAASAELAVALPAVAVVVAAVLSVGQVVLTQVRCVDAARAAARAAARGDAAGQVRSLALAQAPGATVAVGRSGATVTVAVARSVSVLLPDGPSVRVVGRASARVEEPPGGPADGGAPRGDTGSATVLVVAACLLALFVAAATATLGSAVVARHRAQSAADLAALAGADVVVGRAGGDPCTAAAAVARAGGGRLTACAVAGADVVVRTSVPWADAGGLLGRGLGPATAAARAGPGS